METLKIKVEIGDRKFEADGPAGIVQGQVNAFMKLTLGGSAETIAAEAAQAAAETGRKLCWSCCSANASFETTLSSAEWIFSGDYAHPDTGCVAPITYSILLRAGNTSPRMEDIARGGTS